jgi:hypothetical protein
MKTYICLWAQKGYWVRNPRTTLVVIARLVTMVTSYHLTTESPHFVTTYRPTVISVTDIALLKIKRIMRPIILLIRHKHRL